jgi:hypothetical protein
MLGRDNFFSRTEEFTCFLNSRTLMALYFNKLQFYSQEMLN